MVRTGVPAELKTADVCITPSGNPIKLHDHPKLQLGGAVRQFDGLAVRCTSIGFRPGFFARQQGRGI